MAREDLLAQLQRDLMLKEGPPPPDENNPIPQITAPYDTTQLSDNAPTFSTPSPSNFKWGGNDVNGNYISPGWKWGQGQYKSNPGSWAWGFRAKTWNVIPNGTTWNTLQSG